MQKNEKSRTKMLVTGIAVTAFVFLGAIIAAAIKHAQNAPPKLFNDGDNGVYRFD